VVHARTLEIFDQIELADKAVQQGQVAERFLMISKGNIKGEVTVGAFGQGQSPYPFALILEQKKTEKLLADHLIETGGNIHWGCELTGFQSRKNSVTVSYKDKEGNNQTIESNYLVGCDGASSFVRHHLGFGFSGETQERTFYVADVKMESPIKHRSDAWFVMVRKGFALFFPMEGEKHYRVIGTVPDELMDKTDIAFSDISAVLKEQMKVDITFTEEIWFSTYKVHSRLAESFSKERCFIAGDAAHIHTPAGGQGMNTGIQDAYNLAWKLAFVIGGKADESLLETYSEERRANAINLLNTTDSLFDVFAGRGTLTNFFRHNILPIILRLVTSVSFLNKRIFPTLSQIGIKYPDSSLTLKSTIGNVAAGDRMPWFEINGKSIYDYLKEPNCKLLYFGTKADIPKIPGIVNISFSTVPEVFGNNTNFYILLRPDNYISYIGKDWKKVGEAMGRMV
jgi:2-polyprenyl-6-methoxyphenol hydroxylase-like FAD-dependent oxidoreductase